MRLLLGLLLSLALSVAPACAWAATDLTPANISIAGVADTVTAADVTGNTFTNTGYEYIEIINASGSSIDVTLDAFPAGGQGSPDGLTITDPVVAVAAGARKRMGPFRKTTFNNGSAKVTVAYSAVASVTVGVYRFSPQP